MSKIKEQWRCRVAPSLGGGFAGHPSQVWGTDDYYGGIMKSEDLVDLKIPSVFFGLYGLRDFYSLWRHEGRKAILWAGSDIRHFVNGYWLDEEGEIKLDPKPLAEWINKNCENYVENEVECVALYKLGILAYIVPSFLGDVKVYQPRFKQNDKVRLYTSVSGDNFELYGWDKIPGLAENNPNVEFHLYGNVSNIEIQRGNVFIHGRVPQGQMDEECVAMTGALRLTQFDGFSEILAKSLLWEQWPVSLIEYPHTLKPENIDMLGLVRGPNEKGREWLLSVVNKYPWNINI